MTDRAPNGPGRSPAVERRYRATRRAVLAGSALALGGASGCLGRAFRDDLPAATVSVQSTERVDDPEHDATVEVADRTARIEGLFAAPTDCVSLDASAFTSRPDEGLVTVEISAAETEAGCDGPAAVAYEGEIEFESAVRDFTLTHSLRDDEDQVPVARYERSD